MTTPRTGRRVRRATIAGRSPSGSGDPSARVTTATDADRMWPCRSPSRTPRISSAAAFASTTRPWGSRTTTPLASAWYTRRSRSSAVRGVSAGAAVAVIVRVRTYASTVAGAKRRYPPGVRADGTRAPAWTRRRTVWGERPSRWAASPVERSRTPSVCRLARIVPRPVSSVIASTVRVGDGQREAQSPTWPSQP